MDKELKEEPNWRIIAASDGRLNTGENQSFASSPPQDESSWISYMVGAQKKGEKVAVTWNCAQEPKEEFKVITD
jgi:hypothetical protein